MSDVRLKFYNDIYDIDFLGDDLESDDGFETAVIISLFSNARVTETELYDGMNDRQGWWGDLFTGFPGDRIGSKLWLLDRGKATQQTRNSAEEYAREALQWFVDDGIASSIEVTASLLNREMIVISVNIFKPRASQPLTYRFQLMWDAQGLSVTRV